MRSSSTPGSQTKQGPAVEQQPNTVELTQQQSQTPEFVAEAYLLLPMNEENAPTLEHFQIHRQTQAALIKSQFVLGAALVRNEISQLPLVARQDDSVTWLTENLEVSYPEEAQLMRISMVGEEKEIRQICQIIDAVIEAYILEVVHKERMRRAEHLENDRRLHEELTEELQNKKERYAVLAKELGPEEAESSSTLSILRLSLETLDERWKRSSQELRQHEAELEKESGVRLMQNASPRKL